MAVDAAPEPIMENNVNLFACMVVLIAGCWVEMLVSTGSGSRVVLLILEAG